MWSCLNALKWAIYSKVLDVEHTFSPLEFEGAAENGISLFDGLQAKTFGVPIDRARICEGQELGISQCN
jgi:hypothetical protein